MKDLFRGLKKEKKNLPFSFPGQVSYQDFADNRFQSSESTVFIRPVLFIQASIAPQVDSFCFPCRNDCCFLLYIKKGQGTIESDKESFDMTAGSGLFGSAEHSLNFKHKEDSLSFLLILLTGDLLWELYKVNNETNIFFDKYQYPDFEQRFSSLLNEYLTAESPLLFDFSRHMDHLLSRIIHQSIRVKYDINKANKQALMRVISYMKEHCCEKLQIGEIATAFGYSSSHFSRIFQSEFKKSPKKYLIELRVAHAEKLLATSDFSIESIGQKCGFNTTAHFVKTFRDIHAMTPLQYRKQLK